MKIHQPHPVPEMNLPDVNGAYLTGGKTIVDIFLFRIILNYYLVASKQELVRH